MTMCKAKRWGDIEDDDDEVEKTCLLPPKQVNGPGANGVKTTTEYKFDDQGRKVKTTTKTRVVVKTVSKTALERRSWAKFGDAVNDNAFSGATVSAEEIKLERPGDNKEKGAKTIPENPTTDNAIRICRNCHRKGDHWTAFCPYKDLVQSSTGVSNNNHSSVGDSAAATSTTSKKYVPPRPTSTTDPRRRNDDNTVRVNNLSEDAQEADLHELFEAFGRVTRTFVATDRSTKMSKGYGFVTFARREDAQKAILKLDGYGYDNLILKVEWSKPKS
ncbi:hypothetical protein RND81_05G264100 [Saponaria officinalis]|uniref:Eukaryotic translation initiation factor 3 subunit G n=1 Tax=Saponaria officinalis TaxID=3572 RepID=A0AAW1L2I7_SAPOF